MATSRGGIGVWDWDQRSGAFNIDAELKQLLGYADHQIDNRVEAWMEHMHAEDRERVLRLAKAFVRGEAPAFEDEHRMLHADGSNALVSVAWRAGVRRSRCSRWYDRHLH